MKQQRLPMTGQLASRAAPAAKDRRDGFLASLDVVLHAVQLPIFSRRGATRPGLDRKRVKEPQQVASGSNSTVQAPSGGTISNAFLHRGTCLGDEPLGRLHVAKGTGPRTTSVKACGGDDMNTFVGRLTALALIHMGY
ncbi:hypothetical protein G6O67_005959 [Ophiocordyceps sinensis]|uniref:Uncharacterized protein n=1 Tax=Ophiocordyceps sinensis TaxID=72228 RepID=A0A8H4LYJ4_9HYPO|nr:hypothetical protein G6O67_005959 [Ophiocordyceps sinensis]